MYVKIVSNNSQFYFKILVFLGLLFHTRKVKLKMTVSIDINLAQSPSYHPPDHQTSSTTHTSKNSQNNPPEVGATCEVPGASYDQSIKAYNSVGRNPFL